MMKEKEGLRHIIIFVTLMCVILGAYLISREIIYRNIEVQEINMNWVHQVDSVEHNGNKFVIKGFAFEIETDAEEGVFEIVLRDAKEGNNIFPKMKYSERNDVNEYFLCNTSFLNSGYQAVFKLSNSDLQNNVYEILIRETQKGTAYKTGVYIAKGEVEYVNPVTFKSPKVEGTDLETIVNEGVLRVYRPEEDMYVYQYGNDLIWIAGPGYVFEREDTYIQWHLETTQKDKLPKERLDNQWYFDNLGFDFTDYEIENANFGVYRVAKRALPKEYSILQMNTGKHIEKWIWKVDFRPYYYFN